MNLFEKIWIYVGFSLLAGLIIINIGVSAGNSNELIELSNRLPYLASMFTIMFFADLIYSMYKYLDKLEEKKK